MANSTFADIQESDESSLKDYLQTFSSDKNARFVAAFRDLNSDGVNEAIVYLLGNEWCGSGGCNTLILSRDGNTWRIVSNITISRPPILILKGITNRWHDIGVLVQGGGVKTSYEAELSFDGKSYPRNPSVPPAKRMEETTLFDNVIISTKDAKLIWR